MFIPFFSYACAFVLHIKCFLFFFNLILFTYFIVNNYNKDLSMQLSVLSLFWDYTYFTTLSQQYISYITVFACFFQRLSCITTKHNCVGDQNVSLNRQIGVAAMEDGDER